MESSSRAIAFLGARGDIAIQREAIERLAEMQGIEIVKWLDGPPIDSLIAEAAAVDVAVVLASSLSAIDSGDGLALKRLFDAGVTTRTAMSEGINPGWEQKKREAQARTAITIRGAAYERIRWGSENDGRPTPTGPCGDCGVEIGQLHVLFCDQEKCPHCGRQLIGSECFPKDVRQGDRGAVGGD